MTRQRLDYYALAPEASRALAGVTRATVQAGLDPVLIHLTSLRASQINGCAYCVDLYYRDALKVSVPDQVWDMLRAFFDEFEAAQLTFAVAAINAWNRSSISMRKGPDVDE